MKFIINLTNNESNTIENVIKNYDNIPTPKYFNIKHLAEAKSVKISYGPMTIETDKKNSVSLELEEGVACKVIMASFLFIDSITSVVKGFIEKLMVFNPKSDVKPNVEYIYPNGDRKMAAASIDNSVELKSMGYRGSMIAKEYAIIGEALDESNVQIALFGNGHYEFVKIVNSKDKEAIATATEEVICHLCEALKDKYDTNNVHWSEKDFNAFIDCHFNG